MRLLTVCSTNINPCLSVTLRFELQTVVLRNGAAPAKRYGGSGETCPGGKGNGHHDRIAPLKTLCFQGGMAEMEGFEPPDGLTRQLISSQPRYDHFDTSPYRFAE